jgi:hypothetical protein
MDVRTVARRELVVLAVGLVALARAVNGPEGTLVAASILAAVGVGTVGALGQDRARRPPFVNALIPAVLAAGAAGAIRYLPVGLLLLPALGLLAFALGWVVRLEERLSEQPSGPTEADRSLVASASAVASFVAFAGVAALVPGGVPEPAAAASGTGAGPTPAGALAEGTLVAIALGDAFVAFVLGYRLSALRFASVRDAAWSATTYAIVIAIAAGAARAIDLPRLAAPAVLTLVLYLWDRIHGTARERRREIRFVWETALLAIAGVVVVAWNLGLRG